MEDGSEAGGTANAVRVWNIEATKVPTSEVETAFASKGVDVASALPQAVNNRLSNIKQTNVVLVKLIRPPKVIHSYCFLHKYLNTSLVVIGQKAGSWFR